jgi:23S rRNA pseudouridine2605 synthase
VASRRAAEELIAQGRVRVDGRVADVLGTRVDPERARIEVDGRRISVAVGQRIIALNKPPGVVTTARDPQGRRTVLDLVPRDVRLFPVGRLDADSEGLLLLTNQGELAHRLTHPRYEIPRVYEAVVRGSVGPGTFSRLRRGVALPDGMAQPQSVRTKGRSVARTHLEIAMTEGRNREVRRMLEALGHPVLRLVRTEYGPISLGRLRQGTWRELTAAEIGALLEAVGL